MDTARGEIELGGTENDYLVDLYGIRKVDGLVDVDKIKAGHGEGELYIKGTSEQNAKLEIVLKTHSDIPSQIFGSIRRSSIIDRVY